MVAGVCVWWHEIPVHPSGHPGTWSMQCQDRPGANNHPLTGLNDIDKQAFMEIKTTTFFFVTK